MSGLLNVSMVGAAVNVALAVVGVACAWVLARLMDHAAGRSRCNSYTGQWITRLQLSPLAVALYFGLRWVGICLLFGLLLSRPY